MSGLEARVYLGYISSKLNYRLHCELVPESGLHRSLGEHVFCGLPNRPLVELFPHGQ